MSAFDLNQPVATTTLPAVRRRLNLNGTLLVGGLIVASVIGTTLLMWMLRHGEATKVTALILLVPPLAAVQAFAFFDETLSGIQLIGFALALVGVVLARSTPARR